MNARIATAIANAAAYSVRLEDGTVLAYGDDPNLVLCAARARARIMLHDGAHVCIEWFEHEDRMFTDCLVLFKQDVRPGDVHQYIGAYNDYRCIVLEYGDTLIAPHRIYDNEAKAWDSITETLMDRWHNGGCEGTFNDYMLDHMQYFAVISLNLWRETARKRRFGVDSVLPA